MFSLVLGKRQFRLKNCPPLPWPCLAYQKPNVSVKGQLWIFKAFYLTQADIKSINSGTKSGSEGELEYATGPATQLDYSEAPLRRGEGSAPKVGVETLISCSSSLLLGQSHQRAASCKGSVKNRAGNGNVRDASRTGVTAANGKLGWEVISSSPPCIGSCGCVLTSPGFPSSGLKLKKRQSFFFLDPIKKGRGKKNQCNSYRNEQTVGELKSWVPADLFQSGPGLSGSHILWGPSPAMTSESPLPWNCLFFMLNSWLCHQTDLFWREGTQICWKKDPQQHSHTSNVSFCCFLGRLGLSPQSLCIFSIKKVLHPKVGVHSMPCNSGTWAQFRRWFIIHWPFSNLAAGSRTFPIRTPTHRAVVCTAWTCCSGNKGCSHWKEKSS